MEMEAIFSTETSVNFQRTTRWYMSDDRPLHNLFLLLIIAICWIDILMSVIYFSCALRNLLTYLLMELSPSWGADNCAATQELPSILQNPKIQYRVHKSLPPAPILSHINPIHTMP
jgi:hypothetical protein